MNRDEKRTRVAAIPPSVVRLGRRRAIYPREPNGGTWVAVNDSGLCFALINWHTIRSEPGGHPLSRGEILPSIVSAGSVRAVALRLKVLPLKKLRPFRLIMINNREKRIVEWQWNLKRLSRSTHHWDALHWFSSGYDEPAAARERERICAIARIDSPRSGVLALRKLHRSHLPRRGPFSICMHRKDAVTVSYTEVVFSKRRATMRYNAGSPCRAATLEKKFIPIRPNL